MNERIRELARRVVGKNKNDVDSISLFDEQIDQFAKLIVKECMSIARGMRNPPNLNYKPSDRFVDELRLHFGVEE